MTLRWIASEEMAVIYKDRMLVDFPESELKPLERIIETMEQGLCRVLTMIEGEQLLAYAVFIFPKGGKHILLDYFAVNKELRGRGSGHKFFELLVPYMHENLPEIEGVFIESERVEPDLTEREIRERRIAFYLDCGCTMTDLESSLFGVTFSILFFGLKGDREVGYDDLDYIYRAMFKEKHYHTQVQIWKK